MEKPEFTTLKSYSINYGTRNFIEIALKEAKTSDGKVSTFVSISKGFISPDDKKKYKRSLGFNVNTEVVDFFIKTLKDLRADVEKAEKKAEKASEE